MKRLVPWMFLLTLSACGPGQPPGAAGPVEITESTACSLDGMLLAEYPGPKAQIHYEQGPPDFYCDTVEMFAMLLRPETSRKVRAVYVQDMGSADWARPRGHWIDARSAWYVHGSSRPGSMGPTIASFAREADARAFAAKYGGRVVRFGEVTYDMVRLDGGALHDQAM